MRDGHLWCAYYIWVDISATILLLAKNTQSVFVRSQPEKIWNRNYLMLFVLIYLGLILTTLSTVVTVTCLLLPLITIAYEMVMLYDTFYVVAIYEKIKKTMF